jgi:hypothetical protein
MGQVVLPQGLLHALQLLLELPRTAHRPTLRHPNMVWRLATLFSTVDFGGTEESNLCMLEFRASVLSLTCASCQN